jgi:hypothetical protein
MSRIWAEQMPFASPQALGVDVGAIKRFHPVFSLVDFVTRCHKTSKYAVQGVQWVRVWAAHRVRGGCAMGLLRGLVCWL